MCEIGGEMPIGCRVEQFGDKSTRVAGCDEAIGCVGKSANHIQYLDALVLLHRQGCGAALTPSRIFNRAWFPS